MSYCSPVGSLALPPCPKGQGFTRFLVMSNRLTKHGFTGEPLHKVWQAMKQRCLNPSDKAYPYYGGRGIQIHSEWVDDYTAFRSWSLSHGYKKGLTFERIDTNGNYEPGNLTFVPQSEQPKNTRRSVKNRPPGDYLGRGYSFNSRGQKWIAYGRDTSGKQKYLGRYSSEAAAREAHTSYLTLPGLKTRGFSRDFHS